MNNLLSDLGGSMRVLITFFGILFYPISQHLFYVNAAKKLFLARTKEKDLLVDCDREC